MTLLALGFLGKHTEQFSRISMLMWFAVTWALMIAGRIATRAVLRTLRSLG